MYKKVVSFLLVAVMAVTLMAGCGSQSKDTENSTSVSATQSTSTPESTAEKNPYEEKISFKVLSLDNSESFMKYPLVVEAKEKFNFDFEIQQVAWDNWDQTVRTLAATDSLPEVITWYNLNYIEYLDWVKQGVLKALPDDISKYPELNKITENYNIFDYIKVDGKLYSFPKVINSNPYNNFDPYFIVYRRDWATKMGKNFAPSQNMTWEEFVAYLKEVKEKDPAGLGDKLVPFEMSDGGQSWMQIVRRWFSPDIYSFKKSDDKYEWGPSNEKSLDGIKALKDLYDNGLLARDSYTDKKLMGKERFFAGRGATYFSNLNIAQINEVIQGIQKNEPGFKETDLGILNVTSPEGKYIVTQKSEWWAAMAFSKNCRDEVMDRWLAVGNWMIEKEQVEKYAYGKPEEDWTKDANGKVTLNWKPEDVIKGGPKDYIMDQRMFQKFFILEGMDVWLEGNPAYSSYLVNDLFKTSLKTFEQNPQYIPTDYYYGFLSSPNKNENAGLISSETNNAIIEGVVSKKPEEVWQKFLNANSEKANAIIEELHAGLAK